MTPTPCGCQVHFVEGHDDSEQIIFCPRHAEAHVAEIETALKHTNRMIGEQATEFAGIKEKLEARVAWLLEAVRKYGRHTGSGSRGSGCQYGKVMYRRGCTCGFTAALAEPPA